jgi:hypothetical protein
MGLTTKEMKQTIIYLQCVTNFVMCLEVVWLVIFTSLTIVGAYISLMYSLLFVFWLFLFLLFSLFFLFLFLLLFCLFLHLAKKSPSRRISFYVQFVVALLQSF